MSDSNDGFAKEYKMSSFFSEMQHFLPNVFCPKSRFNLNVFDR